MPLSIIDDELCYTDVQGDIHALDTTEGVTAGSLWLSDKLFYHDMTYIKVEI